MNTEESLSLNAQYERAKVLFEEKLNIVKELMPYKATAPKQYADALTEFKTVETTLNNLMWKLSPLYKELNQNNNNNTIF